MIEYIKDALTLDLLLDKCTDYIEECNCFSKREHYREEIFNINVLNNLHEKWVKFVTTDIFKKAIGEIDFITENKVFVEEN